MATDAPQGDALLVPGVEERGDLFRRTAALVNARGFSHFVLAPLLRPIEQDFPDRWQGGPVSARRVADRLLRYAGLHDLRAEITVVDEGVGRPWDGGVHLLGLRERTVDLAVERGRLEDPAALVPAVAREVARAFRGFHRLPSDPGEEAERDVDVTAAYLGFGLLTAAASRRQRATARRRAPVLEGLGAISQQGLAFLLAVHAHARGRPREEEVALRTHLSANPWTFFRAAVELLGAEPLPVRVRLGIPEPSTWPPPPDLAYLRQRSAEETEDEGTPSADPVAGKNAGRAVFRIESSMAFRLGRALSIPVLLLGGLAAGPLHVPVTLPQVAAAALGLGILGLVVGRFFRDDRCSDPRCSARLDREAVVCPRCGGSVRGTIQHAADRLAAEDALTATEAAPEPTAAPGPTAVAQDRRD